MMKENVSNYRVLSTFQQSSITVAHHRNVSFPFPSNFAAVSIFPIQCACVTIETQWMTTYGLWEQWAFQIYLYVLKIQSIFVSCTLSLLCCTRNQYSPKRMNTSQSACWIFFFVCQFVRKQMIMELFVVLSTRTTRIFPPSFLGTCTSTNTPKKKWEMFFVFSCCFLLLFKVLIKWKAHQIARIQFYRLSIPLYFNFNTPYKMWLDCFKFEYISHLYKLYVFKR